MATVKPQLRRDSLKRALDQGPRADDSGDPCFRDLEELALFFDQSDVLALVNKALYALDYQRAFHRKRAEQRKQERREAAVARAQAPLTPKADLKQVLRALRREVDEDLGPNGVFTADTEEANTGESDAEALSAIDQAFARKPLDCSSNG